MIHFVLMYLVIFISYLVKYTRHNFILYLDVLKEALYRIWCGANRLGNSGVHTLGDNSAFVNPAGQLLFTGGVRPEWMASA